MMGAARDDSTLAREVYFLTFARDIAETATMPLMVTGGIDGVRSPIRSSRSGVATAGVATALAIHPDLPRRWMQGHDDAPSLKPISWKSKPLASAAQLAAVKYQLAGLSQGRPTAPGVRPAWPRLLSQIAMRRRARRYRRWIAERRLG